MRKGCQINNKTVGLIFLIYTVSFCLTACSEDSFNLNTPSVKQVTPTQVLKKFTIVQTDNGHKQWEMEAAEARIYDQKHQAVVTGIRVKFFENDAVTSNLNADRGTMNSSTGDMEVEGKVVVHSLAEKTTIETTKLWYVDKENKIFSDQFVKETRPDVIITGWGLETDPSLRQVVIKKDIKAQVLDQKKGQ
ncbi:MAG: LPS export ABC transporter periplasmic protein LptC [bacterium]